MNGGVRAALAILVILAGVAMVIYAIQGMWPIAPLHDLSEPGVRPTNPGEPRAE